MLQKLLWCQPTETLQESMDKWLKLIQIAPFLIPVFQGKYFKISYGFCNNSILFLPDTTSKSILGSEIILYFLWELVSLFFISTNFNTNSKFVFMLAILCFDEVAAAAVYVSGFRWVSSKLNAGFMLKSSTNLLKTTNK